MIPLVRSEIHLMRGGVFRCFGTALSFALCRSFGTALTFALCRSFGTALRAGGASPLYPSGGPVRTAFAVHIAEGTPSPPHLLWGFAGISPPAGCDPRRIGLGAWGRSHQTRSSQNK